MTARSGSKLSFILLIFKESLRSFAKNNHFDTAASLAYYGFFAFIPLFFIVLSFLSIKIMSPQLLIGAIEHITGQIFPQFGKVITDEVHFLIEHRNAMGLFGFIVLFWSITPLINATRNVFSTIFNVDSKVSFLKAITVDIIALSVIILLFAALLASELYFDTFSTSPQLQGPFVSRVIHYVIPFVVTFVAILFFYIIFSPLRLKISHLLVASLFVAFFWTFMKEFFSGFIFSNPHYGFAFGSLRAIFVIIVWSYCSFCMLLFGGEIMATMRNREIILLKKLFFKRPVSEGVNKQILEKFVKNYSEGERIYEEGEPASCMFYILSGEVLIRKDQKGSVTLREGTYFGEVSMFLEEPRTDRASAMMNDTKLVIISRDNFQTIIKGHPMVAFNILKEMAFRLKMNG